MTPAQTIPILARWIRELQYDLLLARQQTSALEGRCHRLEQAVRRDALTRRDWIKRGHRERV